MTDLSRFLCCFYRKYTHRWIPYPDIYPDHGKNDTKNTQQTVTDNNGYRTNTLSTIYLMATEPTEEHGKINALIEIFSCSSVGSVAKISVFLST